MTAWWWAQICSKHVEDYINRLLYNLIVHQVGHLPESYQDARSAKHKIRKAVSTNMVTFCNFWIQKSAKAEERILERKSYSYSNSWGIAQYFVISNSQTEWFKNYVVLPKCFPNMNNLKLIFSAPRLFCLNLTSTFSKISGCTDARFIWYFSVSLLLSYILCYNWYRQYTTSTKTRCLFTTGLFLATCFGR